MSVASRRLRTIALLAAIVAPAAHAQDVQYTTVTKVDFGGGMNAIMRMAGASEVKETAYIKGRKLRSDGEKQSTIFDLDNSRYIILDHAAKTYMSVPLADMARAATAGTRGMRAEASKDQLKTSAVDSAGNKADFITDLKVEPTKERRNINGNDAERVLVTMETDVRVTPQAMKKAAEEAQKVEGIAVKSTMYLVIVAPDQKFDRALALKETEGAGGAAEKPKGLRGMIGRAIESQGKQEQKAPADQQQSQGTLARVITDIRDVRATSVPASMFDIPAGYREVQPPSAPR
jgi:hypothetical protein